jgi:hypothetical protein
MKFEEYFLYDFMAERGISVFFVLLVVAMVFVALRIELPASAFLLAMVAYVIFCFLWLISFVLISNIYAIFN